MNPHLGLSIAVCTRNRPDDLVRCIASISVQSLPSVPLEIIIIDDGELGISSMLEMYQWIQHTSIELVYHKKLQPGLLYSRIESIALAQYDLLLFLDDDVELYPNYLKHLVEIYQDHPEIAGVGGKDQLIHSNYLWNLFTRLILYSSGHPGKLSVSGYGGSMPMWKAMKENFTTEFLLGCNMSFRKDALRELKAVHWLNSYSLGEDIYLSYVAKQKGKLIISKQLNVNHHQSVVSRDKEEQVAYTQIVNHHFLLKLKQAKPRQFIFLLWTAWGLLTRALLKKQLRRQTKGYWRAIRLISQELLQTKPGQGGGKMKFSLVLATIGRTAEVEKFMEHLNQQTYRNFELLIVDQNTDDRLVPLIHKYASMFSIIHLRSDKGISLARNVGLRHISGDFVSFPDDDCWYDPDVLEKAILLFVNCPEYDGLTGRSTDDEGNDTAGKYDKTPGLVDPINVWKRAISFTIFLRRNVCDAIGAFDEEIGIGAKTIYGSGEETDYVLRAIQQHKVFYSPDFTINHANPLLKFSSQVISRGYTYGCGFGRVVRKHRYDLLFILRALIRPILGMIFFTITFRISKSMYYWNSFRGRLRGML